MAIECINDTPKNEYLRRIAPVQNDVKLKCAHCTITPMDTNKVVTLIVLGDRILIIMHVINNTYFSTMLINFFNQ